MRSFSLIRTATAVQQAQRKSLAVVGNGARRMFSVEVVDRSEGDVNVSPLRKEYAKKSINLATQAILEEDAKYFLHQSLSSPCLNVLDKVKGIHIHDHQGRQYMDFHGNSVHQVGFGNPEVIQAIKDQMDDLSFCTRRYTNKTAIKLAKTLSEIAPGDLNRVLFTPSGTASIGIAMKLARMATKRHKTISMWDSFHGASLDAISIGGEAIFKKGVGPLLPGAQQVPPPDEYRCMFGCSNNGGSCTLKCADYIEYVMEREGDIAAVISEPIRWTPYVPKPSYWQKIRKLCDKHGALLIMDEIPNSLGRTGNGFFSFEMFGIVPDIVVIGKGLGGGILPLSGIIAREHLNDVCKNVALGHYTHEKNPVSCAAALATINYIKKNNLIENAKTLGEFGIERMKQLKAKHAIIGDVRGVGLLMGLELVTNRETKERAYDHAERVMYLALEKGLSFKLTMGNIITLCPPLTVTKEELSHAFDIIDECLKEVS